MRGTNKDTFSKDHCKGPKSSSSSKHCESRTLVYTAGSMIHMQQTHQVLEHPLGLLQKLLTHHTHDLQGSHCPVPECCAATSDSLNCSSKAGGCFSNFAPYLHTHTLHHTPQDHYEIYQLHTNTSKSFDLTSRIYLGTQALPPSELYGLAGSNLQLCDAQCCTRPVKQKLCWSRILPKLACRVS